MASIQTLQTQQKHARLIRFLTIFGPVLFMVGYFVLLYAGVNGAMGGIANPSGNDLTYAIGSAGILMMVAGWLYIMSLPFLVRSRRLFVIFVLISLVIGAFFWLG